MLVGPLATVSMAEAVRALPHEVGSFGCNGREREIERERVRIC